MCPEGAPFLRFAVEFQVMYLIGRPIYVAWTIASFVTVLMLFAYNCRWKSRIGSYLSYMGSAITGSSEGKNLRSAMIATCFFCFFTMLVLLARIILFLLFAKTFFHPAIEWIQFILVCICCFGLLADSTYPKCEKIFSEQTANYFKSIIETKRKKRVLWIDIPEWVGMYNNTLKDCKNMTRGELVGCQIREFCLSGHDANARTFKLYIIFTSIGVIWPVLLHHLKVPEC